MTATAGQGLKQRIRRGEIIVALRPPITITRPELERALSKGTYDLIYIDGQHTAFTDEQLVQISATAETLGLPVQFRIPHTRLTYLIGRFLDLGPSSILVPEVSQVESAEEAVAFAYYPPLGRRSWGGVARYGLAGRSSRGAYAPWWNDTVVVSVQIESIEAVDNARALAVPGVDYLAFGPNDLSFSLESNPGYRLRTVDDCARDVVKQLAGTGVPLGMAVPTEPGERQHYIDLGYTLFQENPRP